MTEKCFFITIFTLELFGLFSPPIWRVQCQKIWQHWMQQRRQLQERNTEKGSSFLSKQYNILFIYNWNIPTIFLFSVIFFGRKLFGHFNFNNYQLPEYRKNFSSVLNSRLEASEHSYYFIA